MDVATQLETAWQRWSQRRARQQLENASISSTQRNMSSSNSSADDELQFDLVAVGLAAAVSDAQLHALFTSSSDISNKSEYDALALLQLPLAPAFARGPQRFHFALVVVAKLLSHYLELDSIDGDSDSAVRMQQLRRIVDVLVLPLLQQQRYARTHAVALAMLQQIVAAANASDVAESLAGSIRDLLLDEASSSDSHHDSNNAHASANATISYSALCRALQLLLASASTTNTNALAFHIQHVCNYAIAHFDAAPLLLRAVAIELVPALLRLAHTTTTARTLATVAVAAWRDRQQLHHHANSSVANVLYLLCVLLPNDPTLVADSDVQALVAFALAHSDALVRKQGLFILHSAFAYYATATAAAAAGDTSNAAALTTWQRFLTASDVIQMHEQLHLLEQVWPHVTQLLEASLVVVSGAAAPPLQATASSSTDWPVTMSFDWLQSLLLRVFQHENPLVRRTFMQSFMATCLTQWRLYGTTASVDTTASFACSASFDAFVRVRLLRAVNDAQMYKTSTKEAFQLTLTAFVASYLSFQLRQLDASTSSRPSVLSTYVDAVHDAVFGPDVSGHSPEALVSLLEVFTTTELQAAAAACSNRTLLLNERALERLRMLMEFRVLRSFPQSTRRRVTQSLVHALTSGFAVASTLSLVAIANVVLVLPLRIVMSDAADTFVRLHRWLRPARADRTNDKDESSDDWFVVALRDALTQYLRIETAPNDVDARPPLRAEQLSRLLLFTSSVRQTPSGSDDQQTATTTTIELCTPLLHFVTAAVDVATTVDSDKLLRLVGAFEQDVARIDVLAATQPPTRLVFNYTPARVYACDTNDKSLLSCASLFACGVRDATHWLDTVLAPRAAAIDACDADATLDSATLNDAAIEQLGAIAVVLAQMATYTMTLDGDTTAIAALDRICASMLQVLSPAAAALVRASDQTLAMQFLAVVASRSTAVDALASLDAAVALPLLLDATLQPNTRSQSHTHGSTLYARCSIEYFTHRWSLLHSVVRASSFVAPPLLQRVFHACVDALPAVGADPHVLSELVHVLSLTLTQFAATFVDTQDCVARLDALFSAVWGEYSDCLAKPDALTRAVVYCIFQPSFLLTAALCSDAGSVMKRWVQRVLAFGDKHRPNVVFHVACRLAQVWRAHPHAALWFIDEIATLLLYREPVIDDKEQLTLAPGSATDERRSDTSGLGAKDKYVRLVLLSMLDEMSVDTATATATNEQQLLETLLLKLLALNLQDDWTKQHMLHSDGFGQQLRCWQALCVLSKHVNSTLVDRVNALLWQAFVFPHLPAMRYYMEIFAMRLLQRFPHVTIERFVVPLLRDYNLMPQVGASLLLAAGYAVHTRLDATLASDHTLCALLIDAMLPWLNAAHGHTRILVQFMLAAVLPRYLHQHKHTQRQAARGTTAAAAIAAVDVSDPYTLSRSDVHVLEQTAAFLSQNKESKRMHRRQLQQLRKFRPEFECSLLGLLSHAVVSDRQELLPSHDALVFSVQFKDAMNELHAQFNRENFAADTPARSLVIAAAANNELLQSPNTAAPLGELNVQRKIATSSSSSSSSSSSAAVLLDDSVLPVAMRQEQRSDALAARGATTVAVLNKRQTPRQPVILCASLVDKVPNLAGLARTCEIFNAQALVVPNLRVCDDPTFSTISVTASKWMPMTQVRPDNGELIAALRQWKQQGYTIVALEQTASSVCLSSYKFPDKIVIVLGKEKEGVPIDVLQVVDVCVEIPQFGLIRSLNVHVSGAILLWEYTQQRMITQQQQAAT